MVDDSCSITVCVITYNHNSFIERCVNSILSQELNYPLKILIADDCSTDGTTEKLIEFSTKYPKKIKLILNKKNFGPEKTWNNLVFSAKSKYIAYMEGDDYWIDTNKLKKQISYLKSVENCKMVFTPALLEENMNIKGIRNKYNSQSKFKLNDVLNLQGGFFPSSSILFKSEILSFPFFGNTSHCTGDFPLAIASTINGYIGYIPEVTTVYTIHSKSQTNSKVIDLENFEKKCNYCFDKNISFYKNQLSLYLNSRQLKKLILKENYLKNSKLLNVRLFSKVHYNPGKLGGYYLMRLLVKYFYIRYVNPQYRKKI